MDSTRGGLILMRQIDQGALDPAAVRAIVALSKDLPRPEVRDLFERFVPDSERVKLLGETINPSQILTLHGDAGRGERLFAADSTQCKSCHRVGPIGAELGPDLSAIGSKYDRPTLLRHLLEPSLQVEPKYVNYLLETKAGIVHSGLLLERTDEIVVLRTLQNETIRVPAAEVDQLLPQSKSLMPESLLRSLTAQQAADLLEYLVTRKGPPG